MICLHFFLINTEVNDDICVVYDVIALRGVWMGAGVFLFLV